MRLYFLVFVRTNIENYLVLLEVATPLSTALSFVASNPTWDNILFGPQFVILCLNVICLRFIRVCKVPRDTECTFLMQVLYLKRKKHIVAINFQLNGFFFKVFVIKCYSDY